MNHFSSFSIPAALTVVVASLSAGCSAASREDVSSEHTQEALRALGPSEVAGAIAYGQTSAPITHTGNPRYRALTFSGAAGDAIDIWVRSKDGDARAWLLAADFSNLANNDNADASTKDSHITFTLTAAATYYIAFRAVSDENATFTVSLAKTNGGNGGGQCDPEVSNCGGVTTDPFDPASCQGPGMTQEQALRRFTVGASVATLARYTIVSRSRSCTALTGCSPWTAATPYGVQAHWTETERDGFYDLPKVGDLSLEIASDRLHVATYLTSDAFTDPISGRADIVLQGDCGQALGIIPNSCIFNQTLKGQARPKTVWSDGVFVGQTSLHKSDEVILAMSCFRAKLSGAYTDPHDSAKQFQVEAVFVSRFPAR